MEKEGVVVYKDWLKIITYPVGIIAAPISAIETGEAFLIIGGFVLSIILFYYHKYLCGGIIIDINEKIISFPKVSLSSVFKPFPRNDISFADIAGIQAVDEVKAENNSMTGVLQLVKTYKFSIHGTFGSKTVKFASREKRDQFYSLLATYGNFS